MLISVTAVVRSDAGIRVSFRCEVGEGFGWWHGPMAPQVGAEKNVELDTPATLVWGETIAPAPATTTDLAPSLRSLDDTHGVELHTRLHSCDTKGTSGLPLGVTGFIHVETSGTPAALGASIVARIEHLDLYDMNL